MMTAEQAIAQYTEHFGGFPYFLFMSASEEAIVSAVEKALADGEEIRPEYSDVDY